MKRQTSATALAVRAGRTESADGRVRFSAAAREAALAHARLRQEEGVLLLAAAREAGVEYQTLRRWLRVTGLAFRPVSVVHPELPPAIVAVLPCGLRLEGLGLDDIVELARRLR